MFMVVLDNAIKFSMPGQPVDVCIKEGQEEYIVIISDYGKGIPDKDIPYIFDRFYKERTDENRTGSGLGLSIAKQVAERHNIEISCKSTQGSGTSFSFRFNKEL